MWLNLISQLSGTSKGDRLLDLGCGTDASKQLVARGYDLVSGAYRSDQDPIAEAEYKAWFEPLGEELPPGAAVLDLGCGCGIPTSQLLADRFAVTGVDISRVQISRAASLVPRAKFIRADMTTVSFPTGCFHSVVCLYAMIHVPLAEQPALISSIHRWLRESGLALLVVGSRAWTGTEEDWLGVSGATMYWSQADAQTYRAWFQAAGFDVLDEVFVPEGTGGHQKFLMRRA